MLIRKIKKSDVEFIIDLMNEGLKYNKKYDPQLYTGVSDKDFRDKINQLNSNSLILVAEDRGTIVGYILGLMKEKTGIIGDLVVSRKYRRKGIGKRLTNSMIKYFKENGCTKSKLNVFEKNTTAIKAYSRYGFKKHIAIMTKKL